MNTKKAGSRREEGGGCHLSPTHVIPIYLRHIKGWKGGGGCHSNPMVYPIYEPELEEGGGAHTIPMLYLLGGREGGREERALSYA